MSRCVAIIEYGMSNLDSVVRAIEECGGSPKVTGRPEELRQADAIVLPGVGSFRAGMESLRARGFEQAMRDRVLRGGVPFLGICLGMQLLATSGEEGGKTAGLGWIEGEVVRLKPRGVDARVPHVGWNEVLYEGAALFLLRNLPSGSDFYFVHSYHLVCSRGTDRLAKTPYCGGFCSIAGQENVFGVQFHPEKSQRAGFRVLENFLRF